MTKTNINEIRSNFRHLVEYVTPAGMVEDENDPNAMGADPMAGGDPNTMGADPMAGADPNGGAQPPQGFGPQGVDKNAAMDGMGGDPNAMGADPNAAFLSTPCGPKPCGG